MSQRSNNNNSSSTNNSNNFLSDYLTVVLNPDMLRLGLGALQQNPQILSFGLNMMQQCPELTANYIQTQANMIRGVDQNITLTQEKEMLTKQNEELKEKNAKLETGLNEERRKLQI